MGKMKGLTVKEYGLSFQGDKNFQRLDNSDVHNLVNM